MSEPTAENIYKRLLHGRPDDYERATRVWGPDGPIEIYDLPSLGWLQLVFASQHEDVPATLLNLDENVLPVLKEAIERIERSKAEGP